MMFSDPVESATIAIRLKRLDKTYRVKEIVEGTIVVVTTEGWDYKNIFLKAAGHVRMVDTPGNRGLFGESNKPLELLHETVNVGGAGSFPQGKTEIPFEFPVRGIGEATLHESYHGVYLNVGYIIGLTIERGVFRGDVHRELEFVVEVPRRIPMNPSPVPFVITHEVAQVEQRERYRKRILPFRITGKLHRGSCPINAPLTGEVTVEHSDAPVKSVEVQLVRVEAVEQNRDFLRESTEIQNLQIGDGDVCRGLAIPIYMIFPRLFSCPTMVTPRFKVEFELNLIIVFGTGCVISENFPVLLYRENDGPHGGV